MSVVRQTGGKRWAIIKYVRLLVSCLIKAFFKYLVLLPEIENVVFRLNEGKIIVVGIGFALIAHGENPKIQDKIRFSINKKVAEEAGLKINAQLFRVGKLVGNK